MFNLFNKSKVRAGKQNNEEKKPVAAAAGKDGQNKKQSPFAALGKTWAKLNNMDRKQAYTWGAIAVVVLVALFTLGSAMGSASDDDFYDFETRGYDLANMPFSSDEAEQYLLASKYPDMQNVEKNALYSEEEKEARQEEDAMDFDMSGEEYDASEYYDGQYYGGASSGGYGGGTTSIGTLNSASLRSATGSGMSGTFGATGDFSNFVSQEKGKDVFSNQKGPGSGSARKALFQAAAGSRAAAGQKDARLLNAKKAMMGGNVKGSDAFLSDSGAVDLSKAAGLNLDPNAPVSSMDPGLFDDALSDAQEQAEDTAEEDEDKYWREVAGELVKMAGQFALSMAQTALQETMSQVKATRDQNAQEYQDWVQKQDFTRLESGDMTNESLNDIMSGSKDAESFMKEADLSFGKTDDGKTDTNVLMRGKEVVARKSGENPSWKVEEGQTLAVSAEQANKINQATQKHWEQDNKSIVRAQKKEIRRNSRAQYWNNRDSQPKWGSGWNSQPSGGDTSPSITVNGVRMYGKLGNDGKTFTNTQNQKFELVGNDEWRMIGN